MDRGTYWDLLSSKEYRALVQRRAGDLESDGCTGVSDFYVIACLDHDIAYRTHMDVFEDPITKDEADLKFQWAIQHESIFGRWSPMAQWRWLGVHLFGKRAWNHDKDTSEGTGESSPDQPGSGSG